MNVKELLLAPIIFIGRVLFTLLSLTIPFVLIYPLIGGVVAIVTLLVAGSSSTAFGISCIAWIAAVGVSVVTGTAITSNQSIRTELWLWWDDIQTMWGF